MSKARAQGSDAETKVEKFFNANGIRARRNALRGTKDRGDVWLVDYASIVSVKDVTKHSIGEWLREARRQAEIETAEQGEQQTFVLIVKERRGPKQTGKVEDWWVITRLSEFVSWHKDG